MVRKSPRKKPPKRISNEAPIKVKIEPVEATAITSKRTKSQTASRNVPQPEVTFKMPLKIELSLQDTTFKPNPPAKKGMKPTRSSDPNIPPYVPPHMLGRDLMNPLSDQIEGSNRGLQKPRFGVKVPNRNLTSPILSHSELNRELLARSRLRRPVVYEDLTSHSAAGSYLFSLKMVSRLAGSMPSKSYPLKLNPETLKLTLNTNSQLYPKLDAKTERELALKQLSEMRSH